MNLSAKLQAAGSTAAPGTETKKIERPTWGGGQEKQESVPTLTPVKKSLAAKTVAKKPAAEDDIPWKNGDKQPDPLPTPACKLPLVTKIVAGCSAKLSKNYNSYEASITVEMTRDATVPLDQQFAVAAGLARQKMVEHLAKTVEVVTQGTDSILNQDPIPY